MHRRSRLPHLPLGPQRPGRRQQEVRLKIKTKSGGIVGNIVIEVAKVKLRKWYPECEILEGREK